jgi:hypothetical protein
MSNIQGKGTWVEDCNNLAPRHELADFHGIGFIAIALSLRTTRNRSILIDCAAVDASAAHVKVIMHLAVWMGHPLIFICTWAEGRREVVKVGGG